MNEYHKIQSVYMREPVNNNKTFLEGEWARPEFGYLAYNQWIADEKVDGMNVRVIWNGSTPEFRGKTDNAQMPPRLLEHLQHVFTPAVMMDTFGDAGGVTLYGEGYGKKIQKGGSNYNPDGNGFYLFDIFAGGMWLRRDSVLDIADKIHGVVPPIQFGTMKLFDAIELCRNGFHSMLGSQNFQAEGLVLRPAVELLDRRGHRIITKVKCRDFWRDTP
jgi:hypothetical protein